MKSQIEIFETGIKDGIMSKNKKFYKENLTQEEINKILSVENEKIEKMFLTLLTDSLLNNGVARWDEDIIDWCIFA